MFNPMHPINHLLPPNPMRGPFNADGHFKVIRERETQMRWQREREDRMKLNEAWEKNLFKRI